MTDWKGTFLRKHITTISFRDLKEMGEGDWEVLDFPELNPVALDSLTDKIMSGCTTGFYQVDMDMHKSSHGGKPRYFYPGTGQGDEPQPTFQGGVGEDVGKKTSPEAQREFTERYGSLDDMTEKSLQEELLVRDFPLSKTSKWPKWAMIISLIALQRREEGFRCD